MSSSISAVILVRSQCSTRYRCNAARLRCQTESSRSQLLQCILMQPADTVRTIAFSYCTSSEAVLMKHGTWPQTLTRMCNQPTVKKPNGRTIGLLYSNPIDCLWKTLRAEGIFGWYKGTTAHFLRIAPHTYVAPVSEFMHHVYSKYGLAESSRSRRTTSSCGCISRRDIAPSRNTPHSRLFCIGWAQLVSLLPFTLGFLRSMVSYISKWRWRLLEDESADAGRGIKRWSQCCDVRSGRLVMR